MNKKNVLFIISSALIIITAFAFNILPIANGTLLATTECTTSAGVKCPTGTARSSCKSGESVGSDGNCHCTQSGASRGSDGYCPGGAPSDSGGDDSDSGDCSDLDTQTAYLQNLYNTVSANLTQARSDLTAASAQYTNGASVIANMNTADIYASCTSGDAGSTSGSGGSLSALASSGNSGTGTSSADTLTGLTGCDGSNSSDDGSCSSNQSQCDALFAKVVSTHQSACIIETEANQLKGIVSTSTATSTNAFGLSLTPNNINVGDTFTINAIINAADVSSYTLGVLNTDGSLLGNLVSNVGISATTRPATATYTFQAPVNMNPGTYTIRISNDANTSESQSAIIIVNGSSTAGTAGGIITGTQDTSALTMNLSAGSIYQGTSFTVNTNLLTSSVQSFSVSVYQNGTNLGTLLSGITPGSSARPAYVQKTFQTSSTIPPGVYTIKVSNDANVNQYQTSNLTVLAGTGNGSVSGFNYQNGTTGTTNGNITNGILFIQPEGGSIQKIGASTPIHWGYNGTVAGNFDIYAQTACPVGNASCSPSYFLVASQVPVVNVLYNWTIPTYLVPGSLVNLSARQGSTLITTGAGFTLGL